MRHVLIGSEFFSKAKNDYQDPDWAIIREFFQNSIDSGATRIDVKVHEDGQGNTVLVVANNGIPMTEEVLLNKLLALGSSGKDFTNGTTGGFGKAKEILYFCHKNYSIESGGLSVSGSGATYELKTLSTPIGGTKSTILIGENCAEALLKNIHQFILFAEWPGKFNVNGQDFRASMRKGEPKRDMGFGMVHIVKSPANKLVVRINGIPMFIRNTDYEKCVVLELKGSSDKILTSNRDSLLWTYSSRLDSLMVELVVNGSNLDSGRPVYSMYSGYRLGNLGTIGSVSEQAANKISVNEAEPKSQIMNASEYAEAAPRAPVSPLGHEFIIKNKIGIKIPSYYTPGEFSPYSAKLVKIWCRTLIQLHKTFEINGLFSVGFVFGNCEAMFESNETHGKVYYINPCEIVKQHNSTSRSLKRRFKLTERDRILAIAIHEFVHGLGYSYHDERYACVLTDTFAKVMQHRDQFNWCFK